MSTEDEVQPHTKQTMFVTILAIVALIWYCVLWTLSILGCQTARKRYRVRPRSPLASAPAANAPGVSILRPLKGLDANLFENLESTFTQEYANYEILLCVADAEDQALDVVRSLLEKYPHVDAKAIIGEEVVGVNPKVNNLIRAFKQAKNDILWVIDSNIQVDPGTLARSVDALLSQPKGSKKRVGVVHHVPYAVASEQDLGGRVEEAFLNTNHAKMYLAINRVAIASCVVGKSCMYRRSDIERVNGDLKPLSTDTNAAAISAGERPSGLPAFGRFLAEDNMLATALWVELGLAHDLGCDVARNAVGHMPLRAYVQRRVRWVRVRRHMVAIATIIEPLTECIILSILGAWALYRLFAIPTFVTFVLHYIAWLTIDLDVYESLAGHPLPAEKRWSFLGAWALRELMALPIWIYGMSGREVEWRGKRYRILKNGETAPAEATRKSWWPIFFGGRRKDGYERLESTVPS